MGELLQNPLAIAGWLLCAAVLLWILFAAFVFARSRRILALQFERENLLVEENLNLLREKRKKVQNDTSAWEGFANFVVFKKIYHGESNICSFYLKPKDERLRLVSFQPGQHLVFQLPIPGAARPVTRRYSLSDRPGRDSYRVSVKLHLPPADVPDAPPGVGSSYFHKQLEEGSVSEYKNLIQVSSPAGDFSVDPFDSKPVVLIGGGVGVTPMLSMFNSIVELNESREVWLIYVIRNQQENIIFDEEMLHERTGEFLRTRGNVHLCIFYTKSSPDKEPGAVEGVKYFAGRPSVAHLKEMLPSNNYRFYICGPEAMMDQFETEIEAWGVPEEDILTERFQPPTKRKTSGNTGEGNTIQFTKSGKEITFSAEDNTILDAAERAGVPIAFDCRAGSCGQCKVAVVAGKMSYNIRTNYKCPPGSCLTCSCIPDGDVVLDC